MNNINANSNNSRSVIITTLSVITALFCIALTFWGNWKNNGILTTDAFIGTMATLIGVCTTIIVGVQIVNMFEVRRMRNQIDELQKQRKELIIEQESFSREMYNTRLCAGNTLAMIALSAQNNHQDDLELSALMQSVIIDDWSSMKGRVLLARYERISELSKQLLISFGNEGAQYWYKNLSVLVIPQGIEYFEEISKLHFSLLSHLKRIANNTSNQ